MFNRRHYIPFNFYLVSFAVLELKESAVKTTSFDTVCKYLTRRKKLTRKLLRARYVMTVKGDRGDDCRFLHRQILENLRGIRQEMSETDTASQLAAVRS